MSLRDLLRGETHPYHERIERNLAICATLPQLSKFSQALGCLYVLEGSTLGGQLIYRHFQKTLGITIEIGGRFFMCYGPETGRMWHALIEQLNSFGNQTQQHSEVTPVACQTFECLEGWLLASSLTSR